MTDDLKNLVQKSISQISMGEKPDMDIETAQKMLSRFEKKTKRDPRINPAPEVDKG